MLSSSINISIPRGLLKIYILKAASKIPVNGIDIINQIDLSTDGAWKPSPGSIYYLLNELSSLEMISSINSLKNVKKYIITNKGKQLLDSLLRDTKKIFQKQFIVLKLISNIVDSDIKQILNNLSNYSKEQ